MGGPLGAIIGRYPSAAATDGGEDAEQGGGGTASLGIIRHDRRFRDLAFRVLFSAFWVAMIVNSSFAFNQGNALSSDEGGCHGQRQPNSLECGCWFGTQASDNEQSSCRQ